MGFHGDMRFDKATYLIRSGRRQTGQCPYWFRHADEQNRILGDLLFDKWQKRPSSAYALYWRLHPSEYAAANGLPANG